MRLILLTVAIAVIVALLLGGSLRVFPSISLRWWGLAIAGVVLQFARVSGTYAYALLLVSFLLLLLFAFVNIQVAGFILIFTGLLLNAVVIVANHGMPVTREALRVSGAMSTLHELVTEGGAKHHLADEGSVLMPLADVMGVGWPIEEVVSVGDLCVQLGVGWYLVAALRPRSA